MEKTMPDDYSIVVDGEPMTPAEYGYLWIKDCCPIHQWCSGARPVDQGVVGYVTSLVGDVRKNVHGDSESQYDWDDQDLQNLETLLRYLKANLGTKAEEKDGSFQNSNLVTINYSRVLEANTDPFPMKQHGDYAAVLAQAMQMGIDSHLEACFVEERGDRCLFHKVAQIATLNGEKVIAPCCGSHPNALSVVVSAESLPVLLRRLFELDYGRNTDAARCLADDILDTIGIDGEA
jgi:hypothetical protein